MYSLSDEGKNAFNTRAWQVNMTISPVEGSELTVTDEDLVLGSLMVDRYTATSDALPVGTATAGQLSFVLNNESHGFDGVVFDGASIYLEFIVSDEENTYTLQIGYFTVDEAPRILNTISLNALDAMVQFDIIPDVGFPCTVASLVTSLAEQALGENKIYDSANLTNLPNANYQIPVAPDRIEELTARQLLQYCCQIMGVNAQIGRDNLLHLLTYPTTSSVAIDETQRYSSDIREEIIVTGVNVTSATGDSNMTGVEGYVLEIKDNPLIQTDPSDIDISSLVGITFAPYTAVTIAMPWMDVGDMITFTKEGTDYPCFITKLAQTVNGNTTLEGTGYSKVRNGYATIDPLTARELQVLRDIRTRASEQVTRAEQNAIDFSTIIGNALGLYNTQIEENGATYYYFHDQETLEDSNVIYTFTAQGFGIATSWGGSHSGTTWQWGVASMGEATSAIFTYLTAHKITADQIDVSSINTSMITLSPDGAFAGGDSINGMIATATEDLRDTVGDNSDTLSTYARQMFIGTLSDVIPGLNDSGVAIGKYVDSDFVPLAVFRSSQLSFYDDSGMEVAWVSSSTLHISQAEIMESMKMGGYKWQIESDGGISLRWVGV